MGKFTDTALWQNLMDEGELPKMKFETYISDDTLYKSGAILLAIVIIAIIVAQIFSYANNKRKVS